MSVGIIKDKNPRHSTSNLSAVEDLADVELVENFTEFGLDAVVHSEDEAEVGEFDEDSDDSD
ncbi:hypothetical protein F2Q69_00035138 [Brassica cretica]|uniref:Uncharacterized protein n=1 Tax=Brassica cretica TaxID=69181 RepID=A0A8S9SEF0_BRACR|nr:hypothetical protein F2Q69_00035138 [Brassica cretica]